MTERFRAVFDLLLEAGVPCNYQVVPALLDEETAAFLRARRRAHPALVALNQHGFRHERAEGGRRRWDEFGGRRPYPEQRAAIAAGREELAARLGDAFGPEVFTPPSHKYDAATVRALIELGFSVISSSVHPEPHARLANAAGRALRRIDVLGRTISYHPGLLPSTSLREISVAIDVDEDSDWRGRRRVKDAATLAREFARARAHSPVVGVMLHHDSYRDAGKLSALRAFLGWLAAEPGVRFATLETLDRELRADPARP